MASVLVPVLYLGLVIGGLIIFSLIYRKRAAAKQIAPYFPSHPARDAYITLLQMSDPATPDAVLKAALVNRACADVARVLRLREDKPALQNLLQKGSIGDDFWNALLAAEKELEAEIVDVVAEANTFVEGWGQIIFETASQVLAVNKMRETFENIPQARADLEARYGVFKRPELPTIQSFASDGQPTPNASSTPTTPAKSSLKLPNGLTSPARTESTLASDAESAVGTSPTKSKKNKKRK